MRTGIWTWEFYHWASIIVHIYSCIYTKKKIHIFMYMWYKIKQILYILFAALPTLPAFLIQPNCNSCLYFGTKSAGSTRKLNLFLSLFLTLPTSVLCKSAKHHIRWSNVKSGTISPSVLFKYQKTNIINEMIQNKTKISK